MLLRSALVHLGSGGVAALQDPGHIACDCAPQTLYTRVGFVLEQRNIPGFSAACLQECNANEEALALVQLPTMLDASVDFSTLKAAAKA